MKNFVKEGKILSQREICLAERKYAEYEISGEIDFKPGQYLMIRTTKRKNTWPYPYFLSRKTEHGAVVLAEQHQDLYLCREGEVVQYWGPRGTTPVKGEENPLLIAEPATYFLMRPFLEAGFDRELIISGKGTDRQRTSAIDHVDIREAAQAAAKEEGAVIIALNPGNAEGFAGYIAEDKREKCFLYISNKKACGIDGCKGCYLHDKNGGIGINVCCQGPFMPLSAIDFEKDGKSLEEFV